MNTPDLATPHCAPPCCCLQAKGSVLASKFNGRWEAKHQVDSQGQIFLDYDPYCFKQVLAYLRSKAIERPDRPAPQPIIAPDSQAQYLALQQYLGLEEFMGKHWYPPQLALPCVMNVAQVTRLQSQILFLAKLPTRSRALMTMLLMLQWYAAQCYLSGS